MEPPPPPPFPAPLPSSPSCGRDGGERGRTDGQAERQNDRLTDRLTNAGTKGQKDGLRRGRKKGRADGGEKRHSRNTHLVSARSRAPALLLQEQSPAQAAPRRRHCRHSRLPLERRTSLRAGRAAPAQPRPRLQGTPGAGRAR